jgi:hypothetical protein
MFSLLQYERLGQLSAAHKEHINAGRAVQQLKALIYDIDSLRMQLRDEDLPEFARLTVKSRQCVQEAIQSYLGMRRILVQSNRDTFIYNEYL